MYKRIISIITTIAIMLTMIVPAMAGNGDNTGEDNMPCSVLISNADLLGEYTLGTEKVFKVTTYASTSVGSTVTRKIEITGDAEVSNFEYYNGSEWKGIEYFNKQITLANDVDRQIRVVFNDAGVYTIRFSMFDTNGTEVAYSERVINVSSDGIELYTGSETTTEETTTIKEETTTAEITTTALETTTEAVTTVVETTTQTATTKENVITTKAVKVPKAIITKAEKKKSAKKVKITLKKLKGVTGYQIQISTTKKFKAKKVIVKNTKKVKVTVKKLKPNKKYYVRARAYKMVNGVKTYGNWSQKKKIKFIK